MGTGTPEDGGGRGTRPEADAPTDSGSAPESGAGPGSASGTGPAYNGGSRAEAAAVSDPGTARRGGRVSLAATGRCDHAVKGGAGATKDGAPARPGGGEVSAGAPRRGALPWRGGVVRLDLPKIALAASGLGLLLVACALSLALGARAIPVGDVWRALTDASGSDIDVTVREIRVPRTVLGIFVGAALAVAGALTQTLTRNPLAEPGLLGVTAGASFAIVVGVAAGFAGSQGSQVGLALVGALAAGAVVYAVGRASPLRLVLAGVAFGSVLQGISLAVRLLDPDTFDHYRFWSVGSLAGREQAPLLLPVLVIATGLVAAMFLTGPLNTLALGEEVAHGLGANVVRTRVAVLAVVTLLAGTATAVAGPIAFLGLMVPHIVRRAAGGSVPWLLTFSMILGPVLLLGADIAGRLLLTTGEVPVEVVVAFIGAPVLIWAVRRYDGNTL